ncbi:NrfD/PsrC family molybdoenzyme membrane anchor subunit [Adlercreutzia shanghongiae]|uniref:NrfD/PsrC family molybdoenzyme membrane anchor subunit n=1 Tax=Adlercreutzia shanghongiae TaxID=3111773 RepID=A0ABU6J0S9_9ACTN|nr:NrfD/PsrC family molybdoenzyme membrane anchor subunit [Adlercreutzia sp. R22]MEC4295737.1 NrfD/PsrC family molybdoenzyme membrane anchor subunit [Adlercreutzia sp. R22]
MVNSFIAWYLFLAGMGAGAFFVSAVVDLSLRRWSPAWLEAAATVTDGGMYLGPATVGLGLVFLLADLGYPERSFQVFFTPSTSLLTLGSWAIVAFVGCSALALLVGGLLETPVMRRIEFALQVLATLFAVFVILYSGVYLSAFPTVPFLNNTLVPVIFTLSALSTGMGMLLVFGFVTRDGEDVAPGVSVCLRVDGVVIALKAITLAVLLLWALASYPERLSAESLVVGCWAGLFWLGVVGAGIVVPAATELWCARRPHSLSYVVGAAAAIVGGLCLRYAFLLAAVRFSVVTGGAVTFWG